MPSKLNADYWDSTASARDVSLFEKNVARYYRDEHIKLIEDWAGGLKGKKILKTDLYEESFSEEKFLFYFSEKGSYVFGMDIASNIAFKAKMQAKASGLVFNTCVACDVRECAFKDSSFDVVISNSTLDNLATGDVDKAMAELRRILKPQGRLILTLDNRNNFLYHLGYQIEKAINTNGYYQDKCYSLREARALAVSNNFIVEDITAIVHIPTPFNKIAILLEKTKIKFFDCLIWHCVKLFSKLGNKRTKFLTGWFIALKLAKNGG